MKKPVKIILDTNFMMIPAQFRVDIYAEIARIMEEKYELCTLDICMWELKTIAKHQKGKDKLNAMLAKKIAESKQVHILKTDKLKNADKILIERSQEGVIIATQDQELKRAIKVLDGKTIGLRQKKYLALED